MRLLKKITCAVLTTCLLLSGCSSNREEEQADTSAAMGRFVETEITPAEAKGAAANPLGVFPHADGSLDYFVATPPSDGDRTPTLLHCHSTDSGANWEMQPVKWFDEIFSQYGNVKSNFVMGLTMDTRKNIYLLVLTNEQRFRLFQIVNQVPKEMKIPDWENPAFYESLRRFSPKTFTVLEDGRIGLVFSGGASGTAFLYDMESGKEIYRAETGRGPFLFQEDQSITIHLNPQEQKFYLSSFDYTGKQKPDPLPLTEANIANDLLCSGPDQSIFLMSQDAVNYVVKNGSIIEKIMNGENYSFGAPSTKLLDFRYGTTNNSFYLLLEDKNLSTRKLFRYTFDPTITANASGKLAVFSLRDSDTLRQAISSFQVKYPTQKIELQIGLPEGTAVTQNDAIRILNAELLAGRGPDVLIMDGLPIDSYLQKGLLADLSNIAKSDSYFTNITGAYEQNGTVCAIPARYIVPLIAANPPLLDRINGLPELAALTQNVPDSAADAMSLAEEERPFFRLNYYSDPLRLFYPVYAGAIRKEGNSLDTAKLSELLESTKKLCDKYPPSDFRDKASLDSTPDVLSRQILSMSPMDFYGEQTQLAVANATGFSDFVVWADSRPTENGEQFISPDLYMKPLCGPTTDVFLPSVVVSVNNSSKNQEIAKQFVETLLSYDAQRPNYWEGFPVNRAAFSDCYSESVNYGLVSYAVDVLQMSSSLSTPIMVDEVLLTAILEEARPYFMDEESLDSVVQNIVRRTRTYLSEQS